MSALVAILKAYCKVRNTEPAKGPLRPFDEAQFPAAGLTCAERFQFFG